MRAILLGFFLAWIAAGCSRPAPPPAAPVDHLQLLELRAEGWPRGRPEQRVARLEVPRELLPWRTDAPRHGITTLEVHPGQPAVRALTLFGSGLRRLAVPGRYDPAAFVRLVVPVRTLESTRLSAGLERGGEIVVQSEPVDLAGAHGWQTATFDFLAARSEQLPFDRLRITVAPESGPIQLGPLDFVDRPLSSWLPALESDPAHVAVGEISRPALGLSSRGTLRATFRAPANGRLELAAAPAPELRLRGQNARLAVHLHDELERETRALLPLEPAGGMPATWRPLEVDLQPHGGQRVELTLSLLAARGHEAFALVAQPFVHVPRTGGKPTVLLVTSSAHRGDHVGADPASAAVVRAGLATPTLDALAERGLLFESCWSSSDTSLPAHAALLTGSSPRDTGVLDELGTLGDDAATLAERFRERGYATLAVLASPELGPRWSGLGRGFELVDAPTLERRSARELIGRALAAAGSVDERPLFLWVQFADARAPYDPPGIHRREQWPPERGNPFDPRRRPVDLPARVLPRHISALRDLDHPAAMYRGEIGYLDAELARLLAVPRIAAGLIAFTADHGQCLGEHGVWWDSVGLHPENLRVPLILVGSNLTPGARVAQPVAQLDLGRTLLHLSGLGQEPFPGRPLTRHLSGRTEEEPRFALAAGGDAASVAVGPWLYVLTLRDRHHPALVEPRRGGRAELYDLASDPRCTTNLVAAQPERAAQLRTLLGDWLAAAPPPRDTGPPPDPARLRLLHDLTVPRGPR